MINATCKALVREAKERFRNEPYPHHKDLYLGRLCCIFRDTYSMNGRTIAAELEMREEIDQPPCWRLVYYYQRVWDAHEDGVFDADFVSEVGIYRAHSVVKALGNNIDLISDLGVGGIFARNKAAMERASTGDMEPRPRCQSWAWTDEMFEILAHGLSHMGATLYYGDTRVKIINKENALLNLIGAAMKAGVIPKKDITS